MMKNLLPLVGFFLILKIVYISVALPDRVPFLFIPPYVAHARDAVISLSKGFSNPGDGSPGVIL